MGLMNILSGRNQRDNKIQGLAFSQPLERLRNTLDVQGLIKDYAVALAWTIDFVVKGIAGEDSSVPAYAQIGRKVKEEPLVRLAAYSAYIMQTLFLDDNPNFYQNEDGTEHEQSKAILQDVERVRAIMYPCDSVVSDAIARHIELEKAAIAGTIDSAKMLLEEVKIYDDLLEVPHEESLDFTLRGIAITAAIAPARALFVESL